MYLDLVDLYIYIKAGYRHPMLAYFRRFSIDKEIFGKGKHKIRDNRHVRRRLIAGGRDCYLLEGGRALTKTFIHRLLWAKP